MNLSDLKAEWEDSEIFHKTIHESFTANVEGVEWLNSHRDWVAQNIFGFGEKSFHWLWKLIVDEMPSEFKFIEIGVFRGQILSLIKMLASAKGKKVDRYGVTPLDNSGGVWESDYEADIKLLHDTFFIPTDYQLYVGSSLDPNIIAQAWVTARYDIVYVDGDHSYDGALSDLINYGAMVKPGGYLVIDDACCDMKMPFGFFQGIQTVTDATLEYMAGHGSQWEFYGNVMHVRIYRRK